MEWGLFESSLYLVALDAAKKRAGKDDFAGSQ
jgi:hypothetical protein